MKIMPYAYDVADLSTTYTYDYARQAWMDINDIHRKEAVTRHIGTRPASITKRMSPVTHLRKSLYHRHTSTRKTSGPGGRQAKARPDTPSDQHHLDVFTKLTVIALAHSIMRAGRSC
jgi:hypothetical protein